jgi:hypothetical protein
MGLVEKRDARHLLQAGTGEDDRDLDLCSAQIGQRLKRFRGALGRDHLVVSAKAPLQIAAERIPRCRVVNGSKDDWITQDAPPSSFGRRKSRRPLAVDRSVFELPDECRNRIVAGRQGNHFSAATASRNDVADADVLGAHVSCHFALWQTIGEPVGRQQLAGNANWLGQ